MKRISLRKLLILFLGIAMYTFCLCDWITAFFENGTFTKLDLLINFLALFIASVCFEFLK